MRLISGAKTDLRRFEVGRPVILPPPPPKQATTPPTNLSADDLMAHWSYGWIMLTQCNTRLQATEDVFSDAK